MLKNIQTTDISNAVIISAVDKVQWQMMYDVPGQSPEIEITLYLSLGQSGYIKIGAYVSLFFNASNNYRLHRHGK